MEEKVPDATKLRKGKRQRNKNSESSIDLSDVSPKKRRSTHSIESLEGQGEGTGSGKRKRKRRDSDTELSHKVEGESGETEDKSNCPRKGKKRKQKSMSDTSASESDVSKSGEFSGSETEKKRKISQENIGEKIGGSGESNAATSKGTREKTPGSKSEKGVQERKRESGGDAELHHNAPLKLEKKGLVSKAEDTGKGTPTTKKDKRKRKKKHKEKSLPELRVIPK